MSADAAQKWMMEGEVEVIDNPLEDPPEAAEKVEPGSTVYVRVPPASAALFFSSSNLVAARGELAQQCPSGGAAKVDKMWTRRQPPV
jgi:hypothetical protein